LAAPIGPSPNPAVCAEPSTPSSAGWQKRKTRPEPNGPHAYLDPVVLEQLERQLRKARGAGPF
jgi:hypothetical protein